MEATDASRLVCVVVVSYQEYSLTHSRACIAVQEEEHSLERTEVGYPEFVEQILQHNAEIVRAMCRVSKPEGTDVAESPQFTPCIASRKLGHAPRGGWSRFHAQFGRFYAIFTELRIGGGWRPIGGGGDADLRTTNQLEHLSTG